MKLDEIAGITLEIRRMEKLTEALTKKVLGLEEQRKEVDVSREKIKASILVVEGEIEEQRKEREAESKSIDELVRERDILNKNVTKMVSATGQVADLI